MGNREEIEAESYRAKLSAKVVLNSINAFEVRYGLPFVFIADPSEAAKQVENWSYWMAREVVSEANDLLRGHKKAQGTT